MLYSVVRSDFSLQKEDLTSVLVTVYVRAAYRTITSTDLPQVPLIFGQGQISKFNSFLTALLLHSFRFLQRKGPSNIADNIIRYHHYHSLKYNVQFQYQQLQICQLAPTLVRKLIQKLKPMQQFPRKVPNFSLRCPSISKKAYKQPVIG